MNVKPNAGQQSPLDASTIGREIRSRAVDRGTDAYAGSSPARSASGADLSMPAQEFVKMRDRLAQVDAPSRATRIARLREQVAAATYRPDAGLIADALLADPAGASLLGLGASAR